MSAIIDLFIHDEDEFGFDTTTVKALPFRVSIDGGRSKLHLGGKAAEKLWWTLGSYLAIAEAETRDEGLDLSWVYVREAVADELWDAQQEAAAIANAEQDAS